MGGKLLVQVENLYRYYGDICAVHDVSFNLQTGQVLGFLGPNGAGKSTTMRLLAGNLAPHAGRILIEDIDLLAHPRSAKTAIGYLPETPPLYPEMTVDEFLQYCARLHLVPRTTIVDAVEQAKQRCGLADVGRRLIGNLSKGYRQRVGIAQAIIHNPTVIILDEPTVGLDPIQVVEIRELIRLLGRERGVILSTHILSEVQAVCSHVQIIHQGRLVYASNIADLDQHRTSVIVGLAMAPLATTLAETKGITRVEELAPGRFRLYHSATADPVPQLVERACNNNWGLRELTPERSDLEKIFIDLTLGQMEAV